MKTVRMLGRILVPASLAILAACQSVPGGKNVTKAPDTGSTTSPGPAASATAPQPDATLQGQRQGAPVAVFLADTVLRSGWTPVPLQTGTLYVNPQPVITKADLTGIQAGANKEGEGLLALQLTEAGKKKIVDSTTQNPNKRLALVVGRTMMAAPGYSTPVTTEQLVFAVGTEQNATAAARAIAGAAADDGGAAGAGAPAGTGSGSYGTGPGSYGTGTGTSGSGASGTGLH